MSSVSAMPPSQRRARGLVATYVLVQFGLLPATEVLRLTGVFNTGLLVRYVGAIFVSWGVLLLARSRRSIVHPIQVALLGVAAIAAIVGVVNGSNPLSVGFASHVMQPIGAAVMVGIGWQLGQVVETQLRYVWRVSIWTALFALALIAAAFAAGLVPRYNGPSYSVLPGLAVSAVGGGGPLVAPLGLLLLSAKRGALIAGAGGLLLALAATSRRRVLRLGLIATMGWLLLALLQPLLASDSSSGRSLAGVQALAEQTTERVEFTVDALGDGSLDSLDVASSGRLTEVRSALALWDSWTPVLGIGAGVKMGATHNIHFSPLGLSTVFGIPAALFIYASCALAVFRGLRRARRSRPSAAAAVYVGMATIYSLTAYNLLVDLAVFVAVGWLLNATNEDASAVDVNVSDLATPSVLR